MHSQDELKDKFQRALEGDDQNFIELGVKKAVQELSTAVHALKDAGVPIAVELFSSPSASHFKLRPKTTGYCTSSVSGNFWFNNTFYPFIIITNEGATKETKIACIKLYISALDGHGNGGYDHHGNKEFDMLADSAWIKKFQDWAIELGSYEQLLCDDYDTHRVFNNNGNKKVRVNFEGNLNLKPPGSSRS